MQRMEYNVTITYLSWIVFYIVLTVTHGTFYDAFPYKAFIIHLGVLFMRFIIAA